MAAQPRCLYAYLTPREKDSAYYVHLTLDSVKRRLVVYYQMNWWKHEDVDKNLFEYYRKGFATVAKKRLTKIKEKSRLNRYSAEGAGFLDSKAFFTDLVGFSDKTTNERLPADMMFYVNSVDKNMEVRVKIPFRALGNMLRELQQLPHFSTDPEKEKVRPRLAFFNLNHVLKPDGTETSGSEDHHPPPPIPSHTGSPEVVADKTPSTEPKPIDL
jgi:hypothetical protein